MYSLALSYVNYREDDAKDICQEAFVKAFNNLDTLNEPSKFGSWLSTIVRRAAIDHIRQNSTRSEVPLVVEKVIQEDMPDGVSEDHAMRQLEKQVIKEVVESIPNRAMKDTVKMYYLGDGMTTEEIAEQLGIPKSTVTTRLDRFRARYQRLLMKRILTVRGET